MSTSGEPHDAEEGQPADLEGNPGCQGAIADATNGEPSHSHCYELVIVSHETWSSHSGNGNQVKHRRRDTEGRVGEIETHGLAQGVRREAEDNESKDIGHP